MPAPRFTGRKTASIANGASQSGVIDLEGYRLVGLIMPATWTAASVTVLAAPTADGTFVPVHLDEGTELTITADGSRAIGISGTKAEALAMWRFLRLRSGTHASPVAQGAQRAIHLICRA
jgi:hypothetical protein